MAAGGRRRQTDRPAGRLRATERPAFADMLGDEGAYELSADLPADTAACEAGDLVEHFADATPRIERVQAPTGDARALIDTPPRSSVAAGTPGDAAARRPSSARRRPGGENVGAERRARPYWPPPPVCSTASSLASAATRAWFIT